MCPSRICIFEGGMNMKKTRFIASALAAVMLVSGSALPAAAEGFESEIGSAGLSQVGGLATPKIVKARKGRAHIRLTWNKVKGASGYKVYRKTKSGKYKLVKTVRGGSNVSCLMDGFNSHTKYTFKIRAYQKKSGKTKFSKYSAAKAVVTKYGIGTNNYSCKAFGVKVPKDKWSMRDWDESEHGDERFGVDMNLYSSITDSEFGRYYAASCAILSEEIHGRLKDKPLEFFVQQYEQDHGSFYEDCYYAVEYGEMFGERCAKIWQDWEDVPDKTEPPVILIYKDGFTYEFYTDYSAKDTRAEEYKAEIDSLLSTFKFG